MNTRTAHVLPRLPKPPRMPYIHPSEPKLHRARAMTIAAAFQCVDGYVLCADSLMSHGSAGDIGSFGSYTRKVFWPLEETRRQTVMCGSGTDGHLLHPFSEAFFRRFATETHENTEQAAKAVLQEFTDTLGAAPNIQMLISSVETGLAIKTDGLIVSPARPVEVLGIGENSLVQFLIDTLHQPDHQGIDEVSVLAIFIVAAAKKYCPQYCGGEIVVATVSTFYEKVIQVRPQSVQEIEELFFTSGKVKLNDLLTEGSKLIRLSS